MQTECKTSQLEFQGFGRRQVVADFDGGRISSDGGLLLLREVAQRSGLLKRFAGCFSDYRDPRLIEHQVEELVAQRVLALAQLGKIVSRNRTVKSQVCSKTALPLPSNDTALRPIVLLLCSELLLVIALCLAGRQRL